MNESPTPGTFWQQDMFVVEIITQNDPRYDNTRNGEVLYVYHTGPVGKVGAFRHADSFYKCWNQMNESPRGIVNMEF